MKQTLNAVIILILAIGFFNAAPTEFHKYDTKVAIIKFKTEVIDYGTVAQNSDGTRIVTFTNKGDAPLLITKVKTSCGCAVASYSQTPIMPGDLGELKIKYNTNTLGAFTKTVTVISNSDDGNKILKIKGHVVASK